MWLTKAAMYVAEVEKNGNFYNVEVYESTDNEGEKLIDKAEFVSPDELALLAEKYGLKLPDDVLEMVVLSHQLNQSMWQLTKKKRKSKSQHLP